MNLKGICIALFIVLATNIFSQNTFNYHTDFNPILNKTKDINDPLYYNTLLVRFQSNDEKLSNYEVLSLLIGHTAKPDYLPYEELTVERKIYALNGEGKYKEALKEANTFLSKHPVNVKTLIEKSYSFYKLGQEDSMNYYMVMGRRIFEAMDFSGDGTRESPIFSLGPADGQDYIIKYLSLEIGTMGSGSDNNGYFLDMLVAIDNGKSETKHFIIEHAVKKMFGGKSAEEMFEEANSKKSKKKKKEK